MGLFYSGSWLQHSHHSTMLCPDIQPARRRSEELQLPHLVAFARLALARFELLHPSQPAAAPDGGSGGSGGSGGGSSEPPCASSLAVAGALQDTAHLHLATRLAAAAPVAPPASSGSTSARVLRGVADLFHSPASLFAPRLQGGWRPGLGAGRLGLHAWGCVMLAGLMARSSHASQTFPLFGPSAAQAWRRRARPRWNAWPAARTCCRRRPGSCAAAASCRRRTRWPA